MPSFPFSLAKGTSLMSPRPRPTLAARCERQKLPPLARFSSPTATERAEMLRGRNLWSDYSTTQPSSPSGPAEGFLDVGERAAAVLDYPNVLHSAPPSLSSPPSLPQLIFKNSASTFTFSKMKVASSASVTTLLVLLIVGILNLSDTSNAACCYVGCNLPRCNPCRTASACGPKGSCASSSCHATRNILRDDTFSLVEEGTLVAKGHEPKHTDDLVKVSSAEALSKKDGVKSRFQERAAKHNIQPNAAGACCKTNCNTIGCTKWCVR